MPSSLIWSLSATIAYYDGSWLSAEMRHDNSGYTTIGPDISRLPEVCELLTGIGLTPLVPLPDPTITKLVFRFAAVYAEAGYVRVIGDTDAVAVISDNLATVRAALINDNDFVVAFGLADSGGGGGDESDVTPPTVITASINAAGTQLTLVFSEVVTGHTGFALTASGGLSTLTYVSGDGSTSVVFSISRTIHTNEILTIDYTAGDVQDVAANLLVNFSGMAVTNGSTVAQSSVTVAEAFLLGASTINTQGLYGTVIKSSTGPRPSTTEFVVGGNSDNGQIVDGDVGLIIFGRRALVGEPTNVGDAAGGEIAALSAFKHPGDVGVPNDFTDFFPFSELSNSAIYTSVGSDASVLVSTNQNVARVAGPNGTDFALRFDGTLNKYIWKSMTGVIGTPPLQTGFYDWYMGGAVKVTNLPGSGAQQVFFGQIRLSPLNIGACVYIHGDGHVPQTDVCSAGERGLTANLALIGSTVISAGSWGYFLVTYKASTNTYCLYYNGVLERRWTPVVTPVVATGIISGGNASQFPVLTQYNQSLRVSGFEGAKCYLYGPANANPQLRCVHGTNFVVVTSFNLPDVTTTQTISGFITKVGGTKINWGFQVSGGNLYFLVGSGAAGVFAYQKVAVLANTNYHARGFIDFDNLRVKLRINDTTNGTPDNPGPQGGNSDVIGFTVGYPNGTEFRIGAATHVDGGPFADEPVLGGRVQTVVVGTGIPDAAFDAKVGAGSLDW
jgi:hypothetical protein